MSAYPDYYPIVEINGEKFTCKDFRETTDRGEYVFDEYTNTGEYIYHRVLEIKFIAPADSFDVFATKWKYETDTYDVSVYDIHHRKFYVHSFNSMVKLERKPHFVPMHLADLSTYRCEVDVTVRFMTSE